MYEEKQIGKYCVTINGDVRWAILAIAFKVSDNFNIKAELNYAQEDWGKTAFDRLKSEEEVTQFLASTARGFHTTFYTGEVKTTKK